MKLIPEIERKKPVKLLDRPGLPEQYHLFDDEMPMPSGRCSGGDEAAAGSWRTGRRQDPARRRGAQLYSGRPLVSKVIDSRTESRDLMWEFDAILRLADAQIAARPSRQPRGRSGPRAEGSRDFIRERLREQLAVDNLRPPGTALVGV